MVETLIVCLLGIMLGTITGLIPGIGVTVSMVFSLPFLAHLDIFNLVIFYTSLACVVQYSGSLTSIYFGIPGETNSLPASIEGIKFTKKHRAGLAIGLCAVGSLIGGTIAVLITYPFIDLITNQLVQSMSTNFKSIIFIMVILLCCFGYNKRNFIVNFSLCALGYALSLPGESNLKQGFQYTFDIDALQMGIPLISVLTAFIMVPTVFSLKNKLHNEINNQNFYLGKVFVLVKKNIKSILRGGLIGYICGFVPGVSTTLSSNTAYTVETKLNSTSVSKKLVASETANNSGQFSSILPLFLLGIPITGSEVILYDLLVTRGWDPTPITYNSSTNILYSLIPWFIFINFVAVLLCWPLSKKIVDFINFSTTQIRIFLVFLILFVNLYFGYLNNMIIFYLATSFILSLAGVFIKKYNCMPLIFIFILGKEIEENIIRQLIFLG